MLLDLQQLCKQYGIVPKGVIHIGAHEGQELTAYNKMNVEQVLFIEANPHVFTRLLSNIENQPNVRAVQCAISNYNGFTTLHVTSFDMSSSILPLKHHKDIYPHIVEVDQIKVPCKTLDVLMEELDLAADEYNVINVDIQGAELLAFEGATETLRNIEAILTEVNYTELYEGCVLIDQLDQFLQTYGFERKITYTDHPTWGDAFYFKPGIPKRGSSIV